MATDNFSFPTYKSPCSIDSPPLWRRSASSAAEDHQYPKEEEEDQDPDIIDILSRSDQRRKSFSLMEVTGGKMGETKDKEEKMDKLWEGFNEELMSRSTTASDDYSGTFSREMMQLGCAGRGFKVSKTNGDHHALSTRKPSVVAIVRVLKRLLFLHNSHHANHKVNKHAW